MGSVEASSSSGALSSTDSERCAVRVFFNVDDEVEEAVWETGCGLAEERALEERRGDMIRYRKATIKQNLRI